MRPAALGILVLCAACVEAPPVAPPPQVRCATSDECSPGQQCVDNYCFGDTTAEFAAELFAPTGRSDMLARAEVQRLDISSENKVDVMFGQSIEITGRVLLHATDELSVAAKVVFQRPSRISGAPDYVVTVDSLPGKRKGEMAFRARLLPNEADESYEVTIYPDDGTLSATAPGGLPPNMLAPPAQISSLQLKANLANYDVTLDRGGLRSLSGQVVDAAYRGMPGMLVRAWARRTTSSPLELVSSTGKTDADGRFELFLPIGRANVVELQIDPGATVKAPSLTRSGVKLPTTTATLPVVLDAIRYPALPGVARYQLPVSGLDATGTRKAALGATVIFSTEILSSATDSVKYETQAEVGASGVAEVDLVPGVLELNRSYEVTILPLANSLPGARWNAEVQIGPPHPETGDGGVLPEIQLPSRVQVVGAVLTSENQPASRVTVRPQLSSAFLAAAEDDRELLSAVRLPEVTTSESGVFVVYLDARLAGRIAEYDLELIPPSGSVLPRWSRDDVTLPTTAGIDKLDLGVVELPGSSLVSGTVRDEKGVPVADAELRVYMRDDATHARQRAVAKSGPAGKISLVLPAP